MIEPLVSIIMPAYNAEKFIKESIDSIMDQTYKNWELLIINDFSKDSTRKIIENYMNTENRIILLDQKENKGVVEARNRGLRESKGKYIAFLDSDDLWEKNKLSIQIKYMIENSLYMTYTEYSYITESGNFIKNIQIPKNLDYKQALKGNQIGCLTVIIDKERIGNFQMPNLKHEDYATWLNILKKEVCACGIQKNLAKYRKVKNSLSSKKINTLIWTFNIFKKNEKLSNIKSIYYLIFHIIKAIKKHKL